MELIININRFHPLLVHLPIGILLLAALMQLFQWRKKSEIFTEAIQFSLLVSFAFSCLAIFTGWRLAQEGGYNPETVWWHKWLGISMTLLTLLLYWANARRSKLTPFLFAGVLVLLIGTGHNGGVLTHGSDYLFSTENKSVLAVNDIQTANVFEAIVFPILNNKCIGCHNASKLKGDLLMNTPEGLLAGGKHGAIFNFETPNESELLQRIALPVSEKLHMPPKGKKQLLADEIKILQWWVLNKACFDCVVGSMADVDKMLPILKKYETSSAVPKGLDVEKISDEKINAMRADEIGVERVDAQSPFVNINLARNQNISQGQLKRLKNISENISELDLSASSFDSEDAWILKKLPNLRNLRLQKTKIVSSDLQKLAKLKYLESINLYDTAIDDSVIEYLLSLPSLKRLYIWNTKLSVEGLQKLSAARPLINIQDAAPTAIFGKSELKIPEIIATQTYFRNSSIVEFAKPLPGTKIYYSLDGRQPDTNALVFDSLINILQTSTLKYFAARAGWKSSPVDSAHFVKATVNIQAAKLDQAPDKNYAGNGVSSLYDLQQGSADFKDGKWLGFQGRHFSATLALDKITTIRKVFIGALAAQPSWIFYPQGFKIWTSVDGVDFKLSKTMEMAAPGRIDETERKIFEVPIVECEAKFVKVQVLSQLKNPDWHGTPGGASWVFVDEILLE